MTMDDVKTGAAEGQRYEFNAAERRCLELLLAPAERLRAEAARIELAALLEARAFVVERLGLPPECQVRVVRSNGLPVGLEVVKLSQPAEPCPAHSSPL